MLGSAESEMVRLISSDTSTLQTDGQLALAIPRHTRLCAVNKRHAVAAQTARSHCKVLSIQYVYYSTKLRVARLLLTDTALRTLSYTAQ